LSKIAIRRSFLSPHRRAALPFLDLPVSQVAIAIKFLHRLRGVVMMKRLPLGSWFNHIVGFDSVAHQFGQFVELTVNAMSFAVSMGPLLGTR
jgi:hypothetical protein